MVDGDAVVYIHKEEGTVAVKMTAQLGSRRPLHCTALGKAYLAALPDQELEARLAGLELTRFTASTITDPAAMAAELGRVRERGWAVDAEEVEEGVYCLGAAVRDHRQLPVAAKNCSSRRPRSSVPDRSPPRAASKPITSAGRPGGSATGRRPAGTRPG